MFVLPESSYVENLMPKVMVLGGGTFERWLGHEGGALTNGISAIIREAPKTSLSPFYHVRTQLEIGSLQSGRRPSPEHSHAVAMILDFPVSRLVRNKFLLFIRYSVCDILL